MVGAYLIERRGVNALVLVHRRHVMDQWRERLATFLELPAGNLGQFWGGRNERTGLVDVAIIQSLQRQGSFTILSGYGHVIINECHRLRLPRNQSNSWQ
jgi:superfamily II DNA or RNA helicase